MNEGAHVFNKSQWNTYWATDLGKLKLIEWEK